MRKTLISVLLLVVAGQAFAQSPPYRDGVHYFSLEQAPGARPGKRVEVTEAFSYLCNHCNTFEPYVQSWKKRLPEGVVFTRIPVEFGRATWGLYARAYVAASVMGIVEESHPVMMDSIWKEQKTPRNMEEMADFYSRFGVDREKFLDTAGSFAVDMQMRREQQMVRSYGVSGTPTMIVNGKYRVSAGGAIGDFDIMLAVVDFLIERELAELAELSTTVEASSAASPEATAE